jgi:hypothetical protein
MVIDDFTHISGVVMLCHFCELCLRCERGHHRRSEV